jgi:hypothetical protein
MEPETLSQVQRTKYLSLIHSFSALSFPFNVHYQLFTFPYFQQSNSVAGLHVFIYELMYFVLF